MGVDELLDQLTADLEEIERTLTELGRSVSAAGCEELLRARDRVLKAIDELHRLKGQ